MTSPTGPINLEFSYLDKRFGTLTKALIQVPVKDLMSVPVLLPLAARTESERFWESLVNSGLLDYGIEEDPVRTITRVRTLSPVELLGYQTAVYQGHLTDYLKGKEVSSQDFQSELLWLYKSLLVFSAKISLAMQESENRMKNEKR